MQEQFEQLREAILSDLDKKLDEKFASAETRLSETIDRKLDEKFAGAEKRLSETIDEKFAGAEERLAGHVSRELGTATQHLKGLMQVHFENMQGLVKVAADGYGGTLESIDRRLKELSTKWDAKIGDHDLVLQNHAERLEKLEEQKQNEKAAT